MVAVTVDLPDDVNRMVEHFKIDSGLNDKRDAIVELLKKCSRERTAESMDDVFADVNRMKKADVSPRDVVGMRRGMYRK